MNIVFNILIPKDSVDTVKWDCKSVDMKMQKDR